MQWFIEILFIYDYISNFIVTGQQFWGNMNDDNPAAISDRYLPGCSNLYLRVNR
jgi:hypothetical protein